MAWIEIASLDAPTAGAFTFAVLDLSTYKRVRLIIADVTVTTDGTDPRLTFYIGGVEIVAGYAWAYDSISSSSTFNTDSASGAVAILLTGNDGNWDVGNAAAESFGAIIDVPHPASVALYKRAFVNSYEIGPTGQSFRNGGVGKLDNAGAIDGFKISGTSNLTAGRVRILGLT
jgi:hypothetical protein